MDDIVEIQRSNWSGKLEEAVLRVFAEGWHRSPEEGWDGLEGRESFRAFHDRTTGAILTERGIRTNPRAPRTSPPDQRTP